MKLFGLILAWFFSFVNTATAHEIYTFISQDCKFHQGLLIKVGEAHMELVDLSGHLKKVERSSIDYLVIHNTVENPLTSLSINSDMHQLMRSVHYNESDKALFSGWPVRFVEDLVIFYDDKGKNHVLELYKISKIRPVAMANPQKKTTNKRQQSLTKRVNLVGKKFKYSLGDLPSQCGGLKKKFTPKGLQPTRILADKIQISEFLSNFEDGFQKFYSYQERTYLYAKPYLYEKRSKLGFLMYSDYHELPSDSVIPMYFQWSSGQAYRFQSFTRIGGQTIESAPTVEPMSAIRSDLKSHIFHASFVGNLHALPAGTEFFTQFKSEIFKAKKITDDDSSKIAHNAVSFNYMALMGGDWGPWSFSVGTFYPTYMILVKDQFREVLASSTTPIFRVLYTRPNWSLRAIVSQTDRSSRNITDLEITLDKEISSIGQLSQFSLSSSFLRIGGDMQLNEDLSIGIDQVFVTGEYNETLVSGDQGRLSFDNFQTSAYVRHWFGEYVTLKLFFNFLRFDQSFNFDGIAAGSETEDETVTGGYFEFVF